MLAMLFAVALAAATEPAPIVRYVDCVRGVDPCANWSNPETCSPTVGNDGLTPETPVASLFEAMRLGSRDVRILPNPGVVCSEPEELEGAGVGKLTIQGP